MHSTFHRWWLGSCITALVLASWFGGFSLAVTVVFTVIYLTGLTLIGSDAAPDGTATADDEDRPTPAGPEGNHDRNAD